MVLIDLTHKTVASITFFVEKHGLLLWVGFHRLYVYEN